MQELPEIRKDFNKSVVFSDESPLFRFPFEPGIGEDVRIRIRVESCDADDIFLNARGISYLMKRVRQERGFDYYEAVLNAGEKPFAYYFVICSGTRIYFYDRLGLSEERREGNADFRLSPGFTIPAWMRGAVIYQIYTDRFCRGYEGSGVLTNEYLYAGAPVRHVEDWNAPVASLDVGNFYGGDLIGVSRKLDYLKALGVEVIYFNPIFVSPSNHKYDAQDYSHIDPHLTGFIRDAGELLPEDAEDNRSAERYRIRTTDPDNLSYADAYFASFVRAAHTKGIRVILDGVFNHCGSFHRWLNREGIYHKEDGYAPGAYEQEGSPYHSYFRFRDQESWPDNASYEGWWDFETLPKLNYDDSPKLMEEVLRIAEKWVSPPYCADGWRLDVAADLGHSSTFNHKFWQKFRDRVKAANPDAVILAEHYGSAREWLMGNEWDTVMNYDAFMEPLTYFLTGMEKHSDGFREDLKGSGRIFFDTMAGNQLVFTGNSLLAAMNQLDNHDHSRFLTRTNGKVGRVAELGAEAADTDISYPIMRIAVLMQMTWPGAPTLYYGDEAGVTGFTDPDCRRTYPWGQENRELLEYYRAVIALHKNHGIFRDGSYIELFAGKNVVVYGRFNDKEAAVIAVNMGRTPARIYVPVRALGLTSREDLLFRRIFCTDENGYTADTVVTDSMGSTLPLLLQPFEASVFITEF